MTKSKLLLACVLAVSSVTAYGVGVNGTKVQPNTQMSRSISENSPECKARGNCGEESPACKARGTC